MAPAQAWREMRPGRGVQWIVLGSWMGGRDECLLSLLLLVWGMRVVRVIAVKKMRMGKGSWVVSWCFDLWLLLKGVSFVCLVIRLAPRGSASAGHALQRWGSCRDAVGRL